MSATANPSFDDATLHALTDDEVFNLVFLLSSDISNALLGARARTTAAQRFNRLLVTHSWLVDDYAALAILDRVRYTLRNAQLVNASWATWAYPLFNEYAPVTTELSSGPAAAISTVPMEDVMPSCPLTSETDALAGPVASEAGPSTGAALGLGNLDFDHFAPPSNASFDEPRNEGEEEDDGDLENKIGGLRTGIREAWCLVRDSQRTLSERRSTLQNVAIAIMPDRPAAAYEAFSPGDCRALLDEIAPSVQGLWQADWVSWAPALWPTFTLPPRDTPGVGSARQSRSPNPEEIHDCALADVRACWAEVRDIALPLERRRHIAHFTAKELQDPRSQYGVLSPKLRRTLLEEISGAAHDIWDATWNSWDQDFWSPLALTSQAGSSSVPTPRGCSGSTPCRVICASAPGCARTNIHSSGAMSDTHLCMGFSILNRKRAVAAAGTLEFKLAGHQFEITVRGAPSSKRAKHELLPEDRRTDALAGPVASEAGPSTGAALGLGNLDFDHFAPPSNASFDEPRNEGEEEDDGDLENKIGGLRTGIREAWCLVRDSQRTLSERRSTLQNVAIAIMPDRPAAAYEAFSPGDCRALLDEIAPSVQGLWQADWVSWAPALWPTFTLPPRDTPGVGSARQSRSPNPEEIHDCALADVRACWAEVRDIALPLERRRHIAHFTAKELQDPRSQYGVLSPKLRRALLEEISGAAHDIWDATWNSWDQDFWSPLALTSQAGSSSVPTPRGSPEPIPAVSKGKQREAPRSTPLFLPPGSDSPPAFVFGTPDTTLLPPTPRKKSVRIHLPPITIPPAPSSAFVTPQASTSSTTRALEAAGEATPRLLIKLPARPTVTPTPELFPGSAAAQQLGLPSTWIDCVEMPPTLPHARRVRLRAVGPPRTPPVISFPTVPSPLEDPEHYNPEYVATLQETLRRLDHNAG
ncbi:hypothetical protein FISHEDRAFT_73138, partial [Fistulina hepatica ATCC 64428]